VPWKTLIFLAFPIIIVSLFVLSYVARPHSQKVTVVLADFINNTGDPGFDHPLKMALKQDLEDSDFPHILSESEVETASRLMGETGEEPITEDVARKICLQSGSKAIVIGLISKASDNYLISLKATGCSTRDVVAAAQASASKKDDIPNALELAASQLRVKFLESR
jgi:hypothetical protein